MITRLDIVGALMASLERDELREEQMLSYYAENDHILKCNAEQALLQYRKETIGEVLEENWPRYAANKELICSNYETFSLVSEQVIDRVANTYGQDLPEIVLVPCIGLFSNGGWAERVDDRSYVCVALERLPEDVHIGILLSHEIVHGISETKWETVLDGFYGEGHATYVSSVLWPGQAEEAYFMMDGEWLSRCLDWIEGNVDRIRQDAAKPLQVLNPYHKFYFSTSYNPDYPNIGYLIGYLYLEHLHTRYTLPQLRTFGRRDNPNQAEFASFISAWTRDVSTR